MIQIPDLGHSMITLASKCTQRKMERVRRTVITVLTTAAADSPRAVDAAAVASGEGVRVGRERKGGRMLAWRIGRM